MLGGYFVSRKSKRSQRKKSPRKVYRPKEPRVSPSGYTRRQLEDQERYMDSYMGTILGSSKSSIDLNGGSLNGGSKGKHKSKRYRHKAHKGPSYHGL